jgi:hypothetical protein
MYERRRWTHLNGKYLLRPLTTRMNKRLLMGVITMTMPVLFPLTEVLFRAPVVGRWFSFAIPVANYVANKDLSLRQRYRLALLDTFDRLAPDFDRPLAESEVRSALQAAGVQDLLRLPNSGVNVTGTRAYAD